MVRSREGHVDSFFEEVATGFTANWPEFTEIPGNGHTRKAIDLNGPDGYSVWRGLHGKKVSFEPGDTVIVVYDVPPTPDARDLGCRYQNACDSDRRYRELRGLDVWFGTAGSYSVVR